MSIENVQKFAAEVTSNPEFGTRAGAVAEGKSPADAIVAVVAFAASEGYDFTPEEMQQFHHASLASRQLSESELSEVAGGIKVNYNFGGNSSSAGDQYLNNSITTVASNTMTAGGIGGQGLANFAVTMSNGGSWSDGVRSFAFGAAQGLNDTKDAVVSGVNYLGSLLGL